MIDFFGMLENACNMVMDNPEWVVLTFIVLLIFIVSFAYK